MPFNPRFAMTADGRGYDPSQDALGNAAASSYDAARWNDRIQQMDRALSGPPTGMLPGQKTFVSPLPGWDRFWGRLGDVERGANAQGYNFDADLVGRGPDTGTGIGSWKMREETGPMAGQTHRLSRGQDPASMRALLGALQRQQGTDNPRVRF
jgi:hypothetical protein